MYKRQDKYSLKYVKKAKKIGENKIRLDKILLDENKAYMSFFVELDYNVNLVKEPSFGGICLKINRKEVENRGLGQTVSLVNNENKKKQLFRIDYEMDLESSIDEKIDSIDLEIQGLEIKEIDKKLSLIHISIAINLLWMLPHNLIDFVDLNYHQCYLT